MSSSLARPRLAFRLLISPSTCWASARLAAIGGRGCERGDGDRSSRKRSEQHVRRRTSSRDAKRSSRAHGTGAPVGPGSHESGRLAICSDDRQPSLPKNPRENWLHNLRRRLSGIELWYGPRPCLGRQPVAACWHLPWRASGFVAALPARGRAARRRPPRRCGREDATLAAKSALGAARASTRSTRAWRPPRTRLGTLERSAASAPQSQRAALDDRAPARPRRRALSQQRLAAPAALHSTTTATRARSSSSSARGRSTRR